MNHIKAVLFDLDGTLLNTLDDIADSMNRVLADLGYPTHPTDAYKYFVGDGVEKLAERVLPENDKNEQAIFLLYILCFDISLNRLFCNRLFKRFKSIKKQSKPPDSGAGSGSGEIRLTSAGRTFNRIG